MEASITNSLGRISGIYMCIRISNYYYTFVIERLSVVSLGLEAAFTLTLGHGAFDLWIRISTVGDTFAVSWLATSCVIAEARFTLALCYVGIIHNFICISAYFHTRVIVTFGIVSLFLVTVITVASVNGALHGWVSISTVSDTFALSWGATSCVIVEAWFTFALCYVGIINNFICISAYFHTRVIVTFGIVSLFLVTVITVASVNGALHGWVSISTVSYTFALSWGATSCVIVEAWFTFALC